MEDHAVSRRKFMTVGLFAIAGTVAAGIGGAALTSIGSPAVTNKREGKWVEAGSAAELPRGQFAKVSLTYDAKDGWLETKIKNLVYVKLDGEAVFALSATCSHLGCNVNYDETTGGFKCPCHTGIYDASGKNISGPPPAPLRQLDAKIEEGKLFINTEPKGGA